MRRITLKSTRRMIVLNLRVRRATPQDSEELVKLADELIRIDDFSNRNVMLKKSFQDPNCGIYVAEVDDMIAGFIEVRVFPDFVEGTPIAIIQNLIVKKDYRQVGIGSNLIKRAVEEAEKKKASEIHVWTEFDNKQAIRFYVKHGFRKRALLLEKETRQNV
ncbi:MAG: GNAT family N-acetyltransferase [Candidatus Bathyarchaeota archaeon]|nr:GNAT family N-acetyltransferase [Candidatus Bathyarchaeota archaeon]